VSVLPTNESKSLWLRVEKRSLEFIKKINFEFSLKESNFKELVFSAKNKCCSVLLTSPEV